MRGLVLCDVAALALSACTVGADFVPPPVVAGDSFGHEPRDVCRRTTDAEPDPQWWRCFRDPALALARRAARRAKSRSQDRGGARREQAAERAIVASQGLPHAEVRAVYVSPRITRRRISCSRRNSPVPCPASRSPRSSRACSPSTIPSRLPKCGGIGHEQKVDADLVISDPRLSLRKGAVAPSGEILLALLHANAGGSSRAIINSGSKRRSSNCRRPRSASFYMARARRKFASLTTIVFAPMT